MKKSFHLLADKKIPFQLFAETSALPASEPFPIVGIGATAGGLEALDQFLGRVPTGSGHNVAIILSFQLRNPLLSQSTSSFLIENLALMLLNPIMM